MIYFWIFFAIGGLQLFVGDYWYCSTGEYQVAYEISNESSCENNDIYHWTHWASYYDHIFEALLTIIRASFANFPDPMIHGVDVAGVHKNPVRDNHQENAVFYIILVFVCSWVIIGLFIGAIFNTFTKVSNDKIPNNIEYFSSKLKELKQLARSNKNERYILIFFILIYKVLIKNLSVRGQ